MEILVAIADCVLVVMTIIAGVVSWFEYRIHKQKENNEHIQAVVKYLRKIDADDSKP